MLNQYHGKNSKVWNSYRKNGVMELNKLTFTLNNDAQTNTMLKRILNDKNSTALELTPMRCYFVRVISLLMHFYITPFLPSINLTAYFLPLNHRIPSRYTRP